MARSARWLLVLLCGCAAAPAPFDGPIATRDGAVYTRTAGTGPDVVLLHGLGDSSLTWHRIEEPLRAAGHRVTVLDALGAGRSDKPDGPYAIEAHVDRLARACDALGIERATLVGNSLGGSVALRFAMRFPDRVRALVLISPGAYPQRGWTDGFLRGIPDVSGWLQRVPPALVAQTALAVNFGDPRAVPRELGPRLVQDLPNARPVELPAIGHVPQPEVPERVLDEVLPFLAAP
ncbi:MAG: alpha/beta fold hydrolase [Planctomycetota bacterium]